MSPRPDEFLVSKIEALLRLSDDDTPVVREAVTRELRALTVDLPSFISERHIILSETHYDVLDHILWDRNRGALVTAWGEWLETEDGPDQLETAMCLLARFQNGARYRPSVSALLDEAAEAFLACGAPATSRELSRYMFEILGYEALFEEKAGSAGMNLARVMETRSGLPIALVCILILLGRRLGLDITGCRFPGGGYARFREEGRLYLIDCSSRGGIVTAEELLSMQGPSRGAAEMVITQEMTPIMLVRRVVNRLVTYYRREKNIINCILLVDLERMLNIQQRSNTVESASS